MGERESLVIPVILSLLSGGCSTHHAARLHTLSDDENCRGSLLLSPLEKAFPGATRGRSSSRCRRDLLPSQILSTGTSDFAVLDLRMGLARSLLLRSSRAAPHLLTRAFRPAPLPRKIKKKNI